MGEANRKRREREAWLGTLSERQRVVAEVALATYERFVRPAEATGMCYRMSFFLREYLASAFETDVEVVVGFVNDGSDDIMMSHAWIECDGMVTDITLHSTDGNTEPGDLVVLDRTIKRGGAKYTYHREKGVAGEAAERELESDATYGWIVERKRQEHAGMAAMSDDRAAARSYLDNAPDGLTYQRLAEIVGANRVSGWVPQ
jgi:hypothetical protein